MNITLLIAARAPLTKSRWIKTRLMEKASLQVAHDGVTMKAAYSMNELSPSPFPSLV